MKIAIDAPDMIYEMGGNAGSNLKAIQQNVAKAAVKPGSAQ